MPTFGDYETVGEPVAITDEGGRVSTIWQAKKRDGREGQLFAIKCFTPQARPGRPETESPDAPLDADPRLEFLETVKQLKKARSEGGRCLAPIHDFGIADDGAWYATDFYKRTLKSWIALRGVVDDAALRHIVSSIVAGCRSIKRSCGRSHGNVKVGNLFLAGKPQAFRKTPLELIDLRPASLVHAFQVGSGGQAASAGEIPEVTEIHDLHALGLIILQLVQGRIVRNEQDYSWPVDQSPDWMKLGKDGERWRQLCNQLLKPTLTLDEVSLDSLAKQFRASGPSRLPLMLGAAAAVCLVGVGIYFALPNSDKKFQARMQAAQSALDATNFTLARQEIDSALQFKPQDSAATELKAKIDRVEDAELKTALEEGERSLAGGDFDEAERQAQKLLDLRKNYPAGEDLLSRTKEARRLAGDKLARQRLEGDYQQELSAGRKAEQRRDWENAKNSFDRALTAAQSLRDEPRQKEARNEVEYTEGMRLGEQLLRDGKPEEAQRQAEKILALRPGDSPAQNLSKRAGDARQANIARYTQKQREADFQQAMDAGHREEQQKDWEAARNSFDHAAGVAQALKDETGGKNARNEMEYAEAMRSGEQLFRDGKFKEAIRQTEKLLAVRGGDLAAQDLLNRATEARRLADDTATRGKRDLDYKTSLAAARTALGKKKYDEAIRQAEAALKARPEGAEADAVRTQAQKEKDLAERTAQNETEFRRAFDAATAALGKNDYDEAIRQAQAALKAKPGDPEANGLLTRAQNGKDLAERTAQNEAEFRRAFDAATAALGNNDYDEAIRQAQAALKARPGDTEANGLLTRARTGKEAAQRAEEFQRYFKAATGAFEAKNYDEAIRQADLALGVRNNDPGALKLRSDAVNAKDLQTALADFNNGDYDAARQLCETHKPVPAFNTLAASIVAEQTALDNARNAPTDVSYSLIDGLKTQSYSQKPPFKALFDQEKTEQANLAQLNALKIQGQYQAVKSQLAGLNNAFLRKQPFDDLRAWADQQASVKEKELLGLDTQFQILLVHYNVLNPKKATSAAAKKESVWGSGLVTGDQITADNSSIASLEANYKSGGFLNRPVDWDNNRKHDRQYYLDHLKSNIGNY